MSRLVRLATGLYRLLLRLPSADSIGAMDRHRLDEMVEVFRHALAAEARRRGAWGFVRFCLGAYLDTLLFAVRERSDAWGKPPESERPAALLVSVADLARHLRFSWRSLRRTPLVSGAATSTSALAIALATLTFAVVYGVVFSPLPFEAGERIVGVELRERDTSSTMQFEAFELHHFRRLQTSFEALEGYFERRVTILDADGHAQSLRAGVVTAGALDHLGVAPALGRTFREGEDFTSEIGHVVLGDAVWRTRFGGQPSVLGRRIEVDGRDLEVIGVMPPGFRFPRQQQLWIPMDFDVPDFASAGLDDAAARGSGRAFHVFGRLKRHRTPAKASAEMALIAERLSVAEASPEAAPFPAMSARTVRFKATQLPAGLDVLMTLLLTVAGGLLLVAGANLMNLLLARAALRTEESTLRQALGARGMDRAWPFLTESLLIVSGGLVLGWWLANLGIGWLGTVSGRFSLPYWVELELSPVVLGVSAGVSLALALLTGLVSAWQGSRGLSLRWNGRAATSRRLSRLSRGLVIAQIALSGALLIGAGLLLRSLWSAHALDRGFDASPVLTSDLRLGARHYPERQARAHFYGEVLEEGRTLPGVASVALVRSPPGTGSTFSWRLEVEGAPGVEAEADGVPVSQGYFDVMGIEMLAGRDFTVAESRYGGPVALIVNETLARRHLGPRPVGQRLRLAPDEPWLEVVGVVRDSYIGSGSGGIGLSAAKRGQVFISWGVAPYSAATLLARSELDSPGPIEPTLNRWLAGLAPSVALYDVAPLERVIAESTWAFELFGALFSLFGVVALVLAILGLYGMTAFAIGQKRREVGVRMALGAAPSSILRWIVGGAAKDLAVGTTAGLLLGYLLAGSMRSLLFGVGTLDPAVYSAVAGLLLATGLGAASLSARSAMEVEPVEVLAR